MRPARPERSAVIRLPPCGEDPIVALERVAMVEEGRSPGGLRIAGADGGDNREVLLERGLRVDQLQWDEQTVIETAGSVEKRIDACFLQQ